MLKRQFPYLLVVLFGLVLVQCGQRGSPTGGPEDTIAPVVLESKPLNNSTQFTGTQISFEFDEYVKVSGFYNEFVISPPVANPPKYKLKGKQLILTFEDDFAENTTYNVFLGKAVKDLNKGNVLTQNQLVFSTGDYVDSLSFSGHVYDAQSMQGENVGMVHLYKTHGDSVPVHTIPSYFAQVINGEFVFNNLAPGSYKVFGLNDINSNYLFDLPNEKIAFQTELINVKPLMDSSEVTLIAFETQNNTQFISNSASWVKGQVKMKFNNPVKEYSIQVIGHQFKKDWKIEKWNEKHDSLILFSEELVPMDSFSLEIRYDRNVDTLAFNMMNKTEMAAAKYFIHHNKEEFSNPSKTPLELVFNKPLVNYNVERMKLVSTKDTTEVAMSQLSDLTGLQLLNTLLPAEHYRLILAPGAVQSIFGDFNKDSLLVVFATAENGALSDLVFEYDFSEINSKGILEFWSGKELKQTHYIDNPIGKLTLSGILPSKYTFKFIADEDENKRWSSGDYWLKKQPEKVYWYKDEVNVRPNWEMEIKWVLTP